ncbi:MAG: dihydrodipicolinate synthase family protein [Alphaproteobacteria bacterium]|jgi:4-hydroxy-tetrahydrodipicolinate synthase|nr:dihydrodipicolinate synthase family protein [Alphaproteobacteria bacterium]
MKEAARKFQGVFAFLVTPTTSDGDANDLDRLRRFIDIQVEAGVDGWFAGSCSIMPEHCVELFRLGHAVGDLASANALFQRMNPICELMGQKSYIRVAHAACELLGRDMGQPRRPLRGLGDGDRQKLASLLEALGPAQAA